MHFYRKGSRNLFYSVYLAFMAESGCDEGVNISDIDATRFPLPDPRSFHACAYTQRRVYKTPSKSTASRPSAFSQKYASTPQYSCEATNKTMGGSYNIEEGLGENRD